jgi:hypothetical protein
MIVGNMLIMADADWDNAPRLTYEPVKDFI